MFESRKCPNPKCSGPLPLVGATLHLCPKCSRVFCSVCGGSVFTKCPYRDCGGPFLGGYTDLGPTKSWWEL